MNCENCKVKIDGSFGTGRFCNRKCACTFVSQQNRETKNNKVSATLTQDKIEKICQVCNDKFYVINSKKEQVSCSYRCSGILKWRDKNYRNILTNHIIDRCKTSNERKRLRDIGREGGFGKKGYLENGIRYSSNFEKDCFEYLVENKIEFEPHKNIPNSSKVSDIYFKDINLYIELDGINREKRQKWLEKEYKYWLKKLEIYERENLNYKIIYNFEEFKKFITIQYKGVNVDGRPIVLQTI